MPPAPIRIPADMRRIVPEVRRIIERTPNARLLDVHRAMEKHSVREMHDEWSELVAAAQDSNQNRETLRTFDPKTKRNTMQEIKRPAHESAVLYALSFNKAFRYNEKTKRIERVTP